MKRCSNCKEEKPLDRFWERGDRPGHLRSHCADCMVRKAAKVRKASDPEIYHQYQRRHEEKWRAADAAGDGRVRELTRKRSNATNRRLRLLILEAYGNACQCCGESEEAFLVIDHVNNDGADHRRELFGQQTGPTSTMYRWIRDHGFPKDRFQILCWSCNSAKAHRGICPHLKFSLLEMVQPQEVAA